MNAWEIYKAELEKLAAINRAQDFSDTGSVIFAEQYERTREAYLEAQRQDAAELAEEQKP